MHRLKEHLKALPGEDEMVSLPYKVKAIGQIECLTLTVGAVPVECTALVVGECGCAPLVRAGALLPLTPGGKMKLQKHIEIKIEILLFWSKGPCLAFRGREGGRMHSAGLRSAVPVERPPCLPAGTSTCPRLVTFPSRVTQSL